MHRCLLFAGASASHSPLVHPAGWLLRLLLLRRLHLTLRCSLPSTQHMSLASASHRSCCLLSSLPPTVSRRLKLPPPPIISHRFHFPSSAGFFITFTSHQPPVVNWHLSSSAGMLIGTCLWRICCLYRCCHHLAVFHFVTPSTGDQQAVALVLAFEATS